MSTFSYSNIAHLNIVSPHQLIAWMRNNTSYACESCPNYRSEWALDPEAVGAVARGGTQQALSFLSSRFIEQFQLYYVSVEDMLKAIEQGLLVGASELRGVMYLARRVPYTERGPAFVLSETDRWDDQLLENLSEDEDIRTYDENDLEPFDDTRFITHDAARQVLPSMARVVRLYSNHEDYNLDFYRFVEELEPLFRTTTGLAYHTYVDVMEILVSRWPPAERPHESLDQAREELRRIITRWNLPDLDALFAPPCDLK